MSFKSAFGNYRVNEELISTTVQGSNGGIPIFGTSGKIASLIPSPIDSNLYIKGGHMQYNNFSEILNVPANQRIAGMEAYLNSKVQLQNSITFITNPGIVTQSNKKGYIISNDQILIGDPINGTNTFINLLSENKYLVAQTDTKLYFSCRDTRELKEFDLITKTYTRTTILTSGGDGSSGNNFVSNGYIANNKLFLGDQTASSVKLYYVNLTTFAVNSIKNTDGVTDLLAGACAHMAYDSTHNKLYYFGAGVTPSVNNNIYVVDTILNKLITTIDAGASGLNSPMYASLNNNTNINTYIPSTNKVWAVARYQDKLFSIDTLTDTISDIITVPSGPGGTTHPTSVNIINTSIYMNGFSNVGVPGSLVAIDMITKQILCNIVVGSGAGGGVGQTVYYQNRLFIPNLWDGSVSIINTVSNELVGTFNVGGQVRALTFVEGTDTIYIANQGTAIAGVLNYQQPDRYTLQSDLTTWERTTGISKNGDYIEGVLNYTQDYSSVMQERSIPDIGYVKTLINKSLQNIVVTSNYNIGSSDQIIIIQGTNGLSISLPDVTVNQNRELIFVHNDRSSYVTTLTTQSGQLINGISTYIMSTDYSTVRLYSTGTKWLIIS